MNAVLKKNQILEYADSAIKKRGIYSNDYFTDLKNGSMSLAEFRKSQEQFFYAVSFFSRPMSALMARFPVPGQRLSILENIVEEHGSFSSSAYHETTFREFLELIGVDVNQIDELSLWPEVRAFNSSLMTACVFDEPEVGVACLGAIEYAFATISSLIGNAVIERGWSTKEELKHYKLHEKIDVEHACDFFNIIEEKWSDPGRNYFIKQGVDMGVYIFDRLYKDLRATSAEIL